jgi:cyclohexa-1,5-dienecarbonyl-CoA hydratase
MTTLELVLAFGKGNVIDLRALDLLRVQLAEHRADPQLRAIFIRAEGPHFSYGASVDEHRPEKVREFLPAFHCFLRELLAIEVPCVASVRGACLGGGLEVALCASFVFAAPDAVFGAPEVRLGVFAPFASTMLPRRIGAAHAERMLLTGVSVPARRALEIGLCDEVADDPDAAARHFIGAELAGKSASSLRLALRAVRRPLLAQLDSALADLERLYLDDLMRTHDAREGIAAFLERRSPRWENR